MLVGISGYAQSGKDTVCEILQHHGIVNSRYAFADPIKDCCNILFNWDKRHSFGELKETEVRIGSDDLDYDGFLKACTYYGLDQYELSSHEIYYQLFEALGIDLESNSIYTSPREIYQLFGTEVGRNCLHKDIWILISPFTDVAIPDIRFPNEAEWLQSLDGVILRVVKDDCKPIRAHESESYIESLHYDHIIDNNGSLYELESQIMDCFGVYEFAIRKFESTDKLEYTESDTFEARIETLRDLNLTASSQGNYDYAPYLHGMANGMILSIAIMEDNLEVNYLPAPKKYTCDNPNDQSPSNWIRDENGNYRHVTINGNDVYIDGVLHIGEPS